MIWKEQLRLCCRVTLTRTTTRMEELSEEEAECRKTWRINRLCQRKNTGQQPFYTQRFIFWQRAALSNQIHEATSAPTVNRQLLHRCVRMLSNWNLQRWQNFLSPIKTETWLTVWFNVSVIVQPSRQITMLPLYVSADHGCLGFVHHINISTCWGGGCCCRVTPVPAACRVRDHFNKPTNSSC